MNYFNRGEALPPEVRLDIYQKLLEDYRRWSPTKFSEGFCFSAKIYIADVLETSSTVYIDTHPYLLPELYELRTYRTNTSSAEDGKNGYWYKNNYERVQALKEAILLLGYNGSAKG